MMPLFVSGQILFTALTLACFVFCARQAIRNGREGRRGWKRPILTDIRNGSGEIGADRLKAIEPEWPRNEKRWPPPTSNSDTTVLRAYAAIAARIARAQTLAAEIVLVIGSAWLSVTLALLWEDFLTSRSEAMEAARRDGLSTVWIDTGTWQQWAHALPIFVITIGLALRLNALNYARLQMAYESAGDRMENTQPDESGETTQPTQSGTVSVKLLDLLKMALRRMLA